MSTARTEFYNWVNSNPTSGIFLLSDDIKIDDTPPSGTISGTATFDGNGKTITIQKTDTSQYFPGLLKSTSAGVTIQNFKISVPNAPSPNLWTLTGGWLLQDDSIGIIKYVSVNATPNIPSLTGGFIKNCTVSGLLSFENCVFSGKLSRDSGGFAYRLTGGSIRNFTNCISNIIFGSSLSGGGAGGFVYQGNPVFNQCISIYNDIDPGASYSGFIFDGLFTVNYNQCYFIAVNTFSGTGFQNINTPSPWVSFKGGCYAIMSNSTSSARVVSNGVSGGTTDYSLLTNLPPGQVGNDITGNIVSGWGGYGNSSQFNTDNWNLTQIPPILKTFESSPWTTYTSAYSPPTINYALICLRKGTFILTSIGEKLVEDLNKEDLITTSSGNVPIISIFEKTIYTDSQSAPCCIPKNTYGDKPHTDLYLTQWHALYIDGKFLHTNCAGYRPLEEEIGKVTTYYHIAVDKYPEIMYANGMPVETSGYYYRPHVINICGKNECQIIVDKHHRYTTHDTHNDLELVS